MNIFIIDFEKAFDTVPHEQLKAKLYRYGITSKTLMWIDSFLCYRKHCVVVNGTKSKWSDVESGILTISFLIVINNIQIIGK
jgi:hypothetical protein